MSLWFADPTAPGKPSVKDITPTSVSVYWQRSEGPVTDYVVRFRYVAFVILPCSLASKKQVFGVKIVPHDDVVKMGKWEKFRAMYLFIHRPVWTTRKQGILVLFYDHRACRCKACNIVS